MTAKANCHASINFEETELRLGLPGGADFEKDADDNSKLKISGKRGFSETEAVDLKLHLSNSSTITSSDKSGRVDRDDKEKVADNVTPSAKAQAVGWPPVRSFRKNAMDAQKANTGNSDSDKAAPLVKVSMDGAPYLRKVDLKMYKSYKELSHALATMFSSFTSEKKDLISHSKLIDPLNDSGFVPTYEDKDGDWMLVGDVPWEMFVESCKRMRIMTKGSETL